MRPEIDDLCRVLQTLPRHQPTLHAAAQAIIEALRRGHKVLTCGNGGSAAEAMHLTTELVGRYDGDRPSLASVFLGADASLMSCIANDYGFDEIFARPVRGLGQPGDILVMFSTSGNAANLRNALQAAREKGVRALAFLGKTGGQCKGMAEWEIIIDSHVTARIQEAQAFLLHLLCDQLEAAFPP